MDEYEAHILELKESKTRRHRPLSSSTETPKLCKLGCIALEYHNKNMNTNIRIFPLLAAYREIHYREQQKAF